jgi:hypothetical protein
LHTLLGVDVAVVSVAAIAAAFPLLHTFGIESRFGVFTAATAFAGFFETLLPRLRAFHFRGSKWPVMHEDATTPKAPSQALPMLKELVWESSHVVDGFAGAQPVFLSMFSKALVDFMAAARRDTQAGAEGPLSRLRTLQLDADIFEAENAAAVLRAAPELRHIQGGIVKDRLGWRDDAAFAGLIHRKLRSLRFEAFVGSRTEKDAFLLNECEQLQAHHFPHLRAVILKRDF